VAAEQPNGHRVEQTEARAEPDAKANVSSPVVGPELDPPPSSEEPGNPLKEKGEEEKEGQAGVLPAAETTGSAVPETSRAEAETVDVAGDASGLSGNQSDEKQQEREPKRPLSGDSSAPHGDATVETSAEIAGTTTNDPVPEPERLSGREKMKMAAAATGEKNATLAASARHPPLPPRGPRQPRPVRPTERQALSDFASSLGGSTGAGKSDKHAAEPEFAPDGSAYVGDGTWEERTWKELTRLREDMFWARVGSAQ
jgi:hypothetical protein